MLRTLRNSLTAAAALAAVCALAQPACAASPQISAQVNENDLATLAPNVHPDATPENDHRGRVAVES